MKVTIELPNNISTILAAIAKATRRPIEEIVARHLEVAEDFAIPLEFLDQCEISMREDEEDAAAFMARVADAFKQATGEPFPADIADLASQRLAGEIDQDEEVLLRQAADLLQRS